MPDSHSLVVHEIEVAPQRRTRRRSAIIEPHHRRTAGTVVRVQPELHRAFRGDRGPDNAQRLLAAAALDFLRLRHGGGRVVGSPRPGRRLGAGGGSLSLEVNWRGHGERAAILDLAGMGDKA